MIMLIPKFPKMKWTPKSIGALMLTCTVCLVILIMIISFMTSPPGTVAPETKDKMFQLITFIAGIISGWILRGDSYEKEDTTKTNEEGQKDTTKETTESRPTSSDSEKTGTP